MMRICLITFLILCLAISTTASNVNVPQTYLDRVANAKALDDPLDRDSMLVWSYGQYCDELARVQDDQTMACLDSLAILASSSKWPNARGIYLRGLGRYHDFRGETEKALKYYDDAIKALKPGHGDLKELAFAYVLKGFLLSNSGLQLACRKVFKEGIPYAKKAKSKNSLCFMLDWEGDYYYYGLNDTVDYAKALHYYKQVEELLPQINYSRIIADNHAVMSGCYYNLGQLDKADYHFDIADSISKEQNLMFVRSALYADKAKVFTARGEHEAAHQLYLKSYSIGEDSKHIEFRARRESNLWQSYKNIGDYEQALKHFEEWHWMEDSLANQDVALKYAELEKNYDIAKKEGEIATLKNKEANNRVKYLLLLGLVSLIGLLIIIRKNTQLRKSQKALVESYKASEEAIFKGEQNERTRIAGELHDGVNSKIAAIKWQLESLNVADEKSQNVIKSSIEMIEDTYQDVRQISHNLVPQALEQDGLEKAVESLLDKLNQKGDIKFEIVYNQKLNQSLRSKIYPVYNIALELINNVLRHAQASNAVVTISRSCDDLKLIVEDDGRGYDQSESSRGFGLNSLQERVKSLRGKLNIESIIDKGTKVEVLIPV